MSMIKRPKNGKRTAKSKIFTLFIIVLLLLVLLSAFFIKNNVTVIESPDGNYQIVGWLIDKGGFGYSGAYYIKEKGFFSKWYKLGTGPFSGEWLSETEFSVYHSNPIDGNIYNFTKENYYKIYSVYDFFKKER